ncbi:hypothetical protein FB45DRAFT_892142 [Roridomyces roridus]|uniref:Uncharacterized protein n=1 Tax=Roridomyces roridus TaxID=1738132 RepID=A0AAD7CER3_9AGAR|nr:hypothetical protein FB45DRAFT_892142 [Roridomyces roridus]
MLSAKPSAYSPSNLEAAILLSPLPSHTTALTSPDKPLFAGLSYIDLSPESSSMSGNNRAFPTSSISPVMISPSKFVENFDIYPVDLFSPSMGVGLGLGLKSPLSHADVPPSPMLGVAPTSFSREYPPSPSPATSAKLVHNSRASDLPLVRPCLSSIPEDLEIRPSPSFKDTQRAELGLGMPSDLQGESASPKPIRISHFRSSLRDFFCSHELPVKHSEARSQAVAAEEHASRRLVRPAQGHRPTGEYTSNATRLAAQTLLYEERQCRRKLEKKALKRGEVLPPKKITPALQHIMFLAEEPVPESGLFEMEVKKDKRRKFFFF